MIDNETSGGNICGYDDNVRCLSTYPAISRNACISELNLIDDTRMNNYYFNHDEITCNVKIIFYIIHFSSYYARSIEYDIKQYCLIGKHRSELFLYANLSDLILA